MKSSTKGWISTVWIELKMGDEKWTKKKTLYRVKREMKNKKSYIVALNSQRTKVRIYTLTWYKNEK